MNAREALTSSRKRKAHQLVNDAPTKERRVLRSSKPAIPTDVVVTHILPTRPQSEIEALVMNAINTRNIGDLFTLVGHTLATVPSYLSSNPEYSKAARLSIMLPILHRLGFKMASDATLRASLKGNLPALKWMKQNNVPWHDDTFAMSARAGNIEIMKWLLQNGCPWGERSFYQAAKNGNLDNMRWLRQNGCPWSERAFVAAASNGNRENMKWMRENGCPNGIWAMMAAALYGDLKLLKWLRANNFIWDSYVFVCAARGGYLNVMKWLRRNGCPWDWQTFVGAVQKGNLENIRWLKENGCPWLNRATLDILSTQYHIDIGNNNIH